MATREQVFLTVIAKLSNLGRPLYDPTTGDYAAYENEYLEALGAFEWDTLTRAMELVRAEWSALTWPPPGRIVQACIVAERERREARPALAPERFQLPPPPEQTPEEAAAIRAKLHRLREGLASGAFDRMTVAEAKRFCETGDYPEGWEDRAAPQKPAARPPTPRQQARAAALQAGGNAARTALMGQAPAAEDGP